MKFPRLLFLVVGAFMAAAVAAQTIPGLVDPAPSIDRQKPRFSAWLETGKVTLDEATARLKKEGLQDAEIDGALVFDSERTFRVASWLARKDSEFTALRNILANSPRAYDGFRRSFHNLALAILDRTVADWKAHPLKLDGPEPCLEEINPTTPEAFFAPQALYLKVGYSFFDLYESVHPRPSPISRWDQDTALRQILRRAPGHHWETLMAPYDFLRESGVGVSEKFDFLHVGEALSLTENGRYAEAMGALWHANYNPYCSDDVLDLLRDYMQGCGVDWETVCVGSIAKWGTMKGLPRYDFSDQKRPLWLDFAEGASSNGIRQMYELIRREGAPDEFVLPFLVACATGSTFTANYGGNYAGEDGGPTLIPGLEEEIPPHQRRLKETRLSRKTPLPAELQQEAIALLHSYLDEGRDPEILLKVGRCLPDDLILKFQDSFRALLHHRSYPVALEARTVLSWIHLADEQTPITPAPAPLRFQLSIPGEREVEVSLFSGRSEMTVRRPEIDGRFSVPVDQWLNLATLHSLPLHSCPKWTNASPVFPRVGGRILWPGPWFDVELPVALPQPKEIMVKPALCELQVDFAVHNGLPADVSMMVELQKFEPLAFWGMGPSVSMNADCPLTFARIQQGSYLLRLRGNGLAEVVQRIILKDKVQRITVPLHTPHRVDGTALYPDGATASLSQVGRLERVLQKDEPPIPYEEISWSLAPGKYRLVILSTEAARGPGSSGPLLNARLPAHQEFIHEFEVKEDSPEKLDLGEFKLLPVSR